MALAVPEELEPLGRKTLDLHEVVQCRPGAIQRQPLVVVGIADAVGVPFDDDAIVRQGANLPRRLTQHGHGLGRELVRPDAESTAAQHQFDGLLAVDTEQHTLAAHLATVGAEEHELVVVDTSRSEQPAVAVPGVPCHARRRRAVAGQRPQRIAARHRDVEAPAHDAGRIGRIDVEAHGLGQALGAERHHVR